MALKRLKVKLTTPSPEKGGIPTIDIEGNDVARFNRASAQITAAEKVMKEVRVDLESTALNEVYERCIESPLTPTASVKLRDDEKEVLLVSFTKAYSKPVDLPKAEELFKERKVDINFYLQEKVVAKFNNKIFLDEKGNFVQKIYDEFRKAIELVSNRLGVVCPLETEKVVSAKEVFHVERFVQFPSVEDQKKLTEYIPNTTRFVPVTVNK